MQTKEQREAESLQAIGKGAHDAVVGLVENLRRASSEPLGSGYEAVDEAEQAIHEDPLSIQYRKGWYSPGEENDAATEYEILLSTGGPATRIVGGINRYGEPESATIEAQDWFQPWTEYGGEQDEDALLEYARHFIYVP